MQTACADPSQKWRYCAAPNRHGGADGGPVLTAAEETALHQLAARVVKAGEILYTKVPREKAETVLRRKWLYVAGQIR